MEVLNNRLENSVIKVKNRRKKEKGGREEERV